MNRNNIIVKKLTEGAIFVAFYGLLAILSRYLITGTDSMIYYFIPLPLAIYTARSPFKMSITVLLASIVICFLFGNPLYVLMLFIPNLVTGFLFGILEIKSSNKIINYVVIFIVMFLSDILSIVAYEIIMKISYWQDIIDFVSKIFSAYIDYDTVAKLTKVLSIVVLALDSIVKETLTFILFIIIVTRLKLIKDYKPKLNVKLIYSPSITVIYVLDYLACGLFTTLYLKSNSMFATIGFLMTMILLCVLSFYLIYQFLMFVRIKIKSDKMIVTVLLTLGGVLLFPISILIGLILNLIRWNFIAAAL